MCTRKHARTHTHTRTTLGCTHGAGNGAIGVTTHTRIAQRPPSLSRGRKGACASARVFTCTEGRAGAGVVVTARGACDYGGRPQGTVIALRQHAFGAC